MDPEPFEKSRSHRVSDEFAYEKLKVIWDADVTVPEIGAYAVMRVQKRELSKDELLSVIEGLTGTTNDIYNLMDNEPERSAGYVGGSGSL